MKFLFILYSSSLILLQTFNDCSCADFPPKSYAFLFPSQPHRAAGVLPNVPFAKGTDAFTLSAWVYQFTKNEWNMYFSFAVPSSLNAIVFGPRDNDWFFYVNETSITFSHFVRVKEWVHYALVWRSQDGSVKFYVNGKLVLSEFYSSMKGKTWADEDGTFVIGQDQDTIGGGFDPAQSFRGEMTEVNAWNYVLTDNEVQKVYQSQLEGNVISWSRTVWSLVNNISVVAPTVHGLCQDDKSVTEIDLLDLRSKDIVLKPEETPSKK